jgi:flagellar hook-associated protein 1 FlgK
MSLTSLLSIARSALLTHQRAMDVTGHNVANALTPGYTRQRLDLVPAAPAQTPLGLMGRGVTDSGVYRARDQFLDAGVWRESGLFGKSDTLRAFLGQIEAVISEPSDFGVAAALDGLLNAFSDLANDPSSSVHRGSVVQNATRFVQRVRSLDSGIAQAGADAVGLMRTTVDEVNRLASQIGDLNRQLLAAGGAERVAPDLADQRDLAVDRLSELIDVRVVERSDGTVGVVAGDTLLVDGTNVRRLEVRTLAGGGTGIGLQGGGDVDPRAGRLEGLTQLVNNEIPGLRTQLDSFVAAVVTEVNAIHQTGFTASGVTGTDFFDPAGLTSQTLDLTAAIQSSSDAIAAGATAAAGDGDVALQIAALRSSPIGALGGRSLGEFYAETVSTFGVAVQDAVQTSSAHQTLLDRAQAQRSSANGVSVDEEMVWLIAQQQAFAAAARLVAAADEMAEDLLRMV